MIRSRRISAAAVAIAAALAAIPPAAPAYDSTARMNGYLQDYHRLGHVGGVPLEQVWIQSGLDVQDYRTLYIAPVQIDPLAYRRRGEEDRQAAFRLANGLRASLLKELQSQGIFQFVSTDPYFSTPKQGALILEMRLTEVNGGNPGLRRWIGFGAGATEVQLEGKLIETRTCRTLIEFADRRLHAGDAIILGSDKSADHTWLMGKDLRRMVDGIGKLFIHLREEGPPSRQRAY